ncbi:uncharacterized protein [Amphiura filiformis]|uniref:uncharacterized protein n=1 Tax=Amphiura filiformis TaxID=82378 RepID=UPI003B21E10C
MTLMYDDDSDDDDNDDDDVNIQKLQGAGINLASSKDDVLVLIGDEDCPIIDLNTTFLLCSAPEDQPSGRNQDGNLDPTVLPKVSIFHGNLQFDVGYVEYKINRSSWKFFSTISAVIVMSILLPIVAGLIGLFVGVAYWYNRKNQRLLKQIWAMQKEISECTLEPLHRCEDDACCSSNSIELSHQLRVKQADVRVNYENLCITKQLGHGAFGEVYEAILHGSDKIPPQLVAVKTIQGKSDPATTIKFVEEGLMMKRFSHANVLGLIGLTFDPQGSPQVVLPLMANGDLKSFLRKHAEIRERQMLSFALDASLGMEYLASKKFVHRDVAARNCMVDDKLQVKIADFGLSRDLVESDYYMCGDLRAKLPIKWMAPECIEQRVFTSMSDVWAFGVLLWEVFSYGDTPYPGIPNHDVFYYIKKGNRMGCPNNCPDTIYKLMTRCWMENPRSRCTFQDVVKFIEPMFSLLPRPPTPVSKSDPLYECPPLFYAGECDGSDHYYLDLDACAEMEQPNDHPKLTASRTGSTNTSTTGIEEVSDINQWSEDVTPSASPPPTPKRNEDSGFPMSEFRSTSMHTPLVSNRKRECGDDAYLNPLQSTQM